MTDILKHFNLNKFKQNISLSANHCLQYVRKASVKDDGIAVTICIPYEHLRSWSDLRGNGTLTETFVQILNAFIVQHGIQLKESERIEGIIRRCCHFVFF